MQIWNTNLKTHVLCADMHMYGEWTERKSPECGYCLPLGKWHAKRYVGTLHLMCDLCCLLPLYPKYTEFKKGLKQMKENIITDSGVNTWVHIIKLFVISTVLKKLKIFLEEQKTRIKAKQRNKILFQAINTDPFIALLQAYNRAKLEVYVCWHFIKKHEVSGIR